MLTIFKNFAIMKVIVTKQSFIQLIKKENTLYMKLKKPDDSELIHIEKMYNQYFPKEERKDFSLMKNLCGEGKCEILALSEGGHLIAFTMSLIGTDYVLVDYLAVSEDFRGVGVGGELIDSLVKHYSKYKVIIVEIERPWCAKSEKENAVRQKRKDFYLKNGFTELNKNIILMGEKMELLVLPICGKMENVFMDYYNIYVHSLGEAFSKSNVIEDL